MQGVAALPGEVAGHLVEVADDALRHADGADVGVSELYHHTPSVISLMAFWTCEHFCGSQSFHFVSAQCGQS